MSYLEDNREELQEEADQRERDIAEGWVPPYAREEKSETRIKWLRALGLTEEDVIEDENGNEYVLPVNGIAYRRVQLPITLQKRNVHSF